MKTISQAEFFGHEGNQGIFKQIEATIKELIANNPRAGNQGSLSVTFEVTRAGVSEVNVDQAGCICVAVRQEERRPTEHGSRTENAEQKYLFDSD